ncbi:hypothetical protein [Chryseobacterium luteum]|nr:hypothetical protein [Chryseobacterium luteum]
MLYVLFSTLIPYEDYTLIAIIIFKIRLLMGAARKLTGSMKFINLPWIG